MSRSLLFHRLQPRSRRPTARKLAIAIMAPAGVTLLGAGLLISLPQASSASGMTVQVAEGDLFFNPNAVTIPAGTNIDIQVTNNGAVGHNFSISDHKNPGLTDLEISLDSAPGQGGTATINAPAGVYYFYCNVPGHEQAGMFGYITVADSATITTADVTVTPRAG